MYICLCNTSDTLTKTDILSGKTLSMPLTITYKISNTNVEDRKKNILVWEFCPVQLSHYGESNGELQL